MITVIPRKIAATSVNGVAVANDGNITLPVDNTPTSNSTNLVTSGGVKTELDALSARIGNAENPAQVWTDIAFTIPTSNWSLLNGKYTTTVQSSSILSTSGVFVNYDDLDNAITPIIAEESTGQVTFTTETIPSGTIAGTFRIIDSVNGIVPMERGGTGIAATSKDNLLTQLGAASTLALTTGLASKQDTLTFDATPTSGSSNPVTSGGVYTAVNEINTALRPKNVGWLNGVNANNFITTGQFMIGATNITNFPVGWGILTVIANRNDTILQMYEANSKIFYREYRNNAWYVWRLLPSADTIAIAAAGNTAPQAITSGQYVIWNSSLYIATTNIASGAALSTSNLQAVPNGGLNALKSSVDTLNSKIANVAHFGTVSVTVANTDSFTITIPSNVTVLGCFIRDWGQPIKYFTQSGTTVTIYLSSALNGGTRVNYIYY